MKKYYLFIIKKEYINIYKNKSYVLYKLLESLYYTKPYDFSYAKNIYNELSNNISVKLLNNYINERIGHKKINNLIKLNSKNELTYLNIMYPCIIVYSNKLSKIFKVFNIYNRNIFVCNFNDKDYFWLNEYLKHRQV